MSFHATLFPLRLQLVGGFGLDVLRWLLEYFFLSWLRYFHDISSVSSVTPSSLGLVYIRYGMLCSVHYNCWFPLFRGFVPYPRWFPLVERLQPLGALVVVFLGFLLALLKAFFNCCCIILRLKEARGGWYTCSRPSCHHHLGRRQTNSVNGRITKVKQCNVWVRLVIFGFL